MTDMKDEPMIAVGWSNQGNIRIQSANHTPMLEIRFFNTNPLTRLEKLSMLYELIQMMLNTAELTEEPVIEQENN